MTADFEPFVEFSLDQKDFGEGELINVGWGKKETQFHGSAGKQAAKENKQLSTPAFEWDSKEPKITWKGDGQLFAISYVNSSNMRKLRVINREGILQSTSEDLEGLEECVCWKPSGSLIACSQRLSNKHNVIFFEKNGLQHGSFTLPVEPTQFKVRGIFWNEDSTILLIWLEPFEKATLYHLIQLWKVGNYHWYLKEEFRFNEVIHDLKWDPEYPLSFYLLTSSHFRRINFINCVDISRGRFENNNAYVAVIDGKKLLITPFCSMVVPPPLAAYEVVFQDQIHAVIFAPSSTLKSDEIQCLPNAMAIEDSGFLEVDPPGTNCNNLLVFHGDDSITFLVQAHPGGELSDFGVEVKMAAAGGQGFVVKNKVHRILAQAKLKWTPDDDSEPFLSGNLYNWSWVSKNTLVASCRNGERNSIIIFELEGIGTENSSILAKNVIQVEGEVISISSSSDPLCVCLQLVTGELLKLDLMKESVYPWMENEVALKFPTACDHVLLCPLDGDKIVPLGLTLRNRLYWANTQLLADCTSVHLHSHHILMTTMSHILLVVPLTTNALRALAQGDGSKYDLIGSRRLERGSRIVTAIPNGSGVLLQMPRGNLEMIHPLPLAVHILKGLIDSKNFSAAMDIMRRQRIDMNLLYDHNPEHFFNNIEEFIRSVGNPHWIDLLIASLNNGNVTATTFASSYGSRETSSSTCEETNKIDLVCEALRKAMQAFDEEKYLLPILSTYVKSSKDEMSLALMKLKEIRNNGRLQVFEEGLRHLLYVADANELCDVALGTYDFDLVMLVFEKSQKDPKEYLPFLNKLKQMEENYRKFKINVHLKRFKRALECIITCEEKYTEECLTLIKKEKLFRSALDIFPEQFSLYSKTCLAYGDYLIEKCYYNEAATMYVRGCSLEEALEAYTKANNWKRVLITAAELNVDKQRFNHLCYSLVATLKEQSYFVEAASIYELYIRSEEDAVECYCKACHWDEAILIANKHHREDLIEMNIKPAVMEQFDAINYKIEESHSNFKEFLQRLIAIRSRKMQEYKDFLEGSEEAHLDSELYSDSSTVTGFSQRSQFSKFGTNASSVSAKTYRSSKNKRKLEKKKYSTKEGATFEDLGLIVALHELMTSICGLTETVSNLNRVLLTFAQDVKARKLQCELDNLIQEMQKNKYKIWFNCSPSEEEQVEFGPQMTTENTLKQMIGHAQKEENFLLQRMNQLEPHYRFPPNLDQLSGWKLFSLR